MENEMLNFVVCAITNLFRVYLIRRFIKLFCPNAENAKFQEVIFYGFFFIVTTTLYWSFKTPWVNVMSNLIGIAILVRLYTKSLKKILFISFATYIINMGCDNIMVMLFVDYQPGKAFNQLYEIITDLLILICVLLTEALIDRKKDDEILYNIPLIFIPLTSLIILNVLIKDGILSDWGHVIASIGILLINFLSFYLYNLLKDNLYRKWENEILKQEAQSYANQLEMTLQAENKIKIMRHDMRHHIMELQILAEKGQTKDIQKYLDQMTDFIKMPKEIVESGNIKTDCLINFFLQKAKENLNEVKIDVSLPEEIKHSFDLNIVLGNLLENAIEASRKSEEKLLIISLYHDAGILKIKVRNSFSGAIMKGRSGFITNKEHKEEHGIGLKSVRKIVENYDGILETRTEGQYFEVKVIMYL